MYVIVGANGFLGAYMQKAVKERTNERILALDANVSNVKNDDRTDWMKCDVTQKQDIERVMELLSQYKNHKVIYLAAYHHPDMVEKNPKTAWNVNITALSNFMNTVGHVKCFFYPSTDSVYGDGGSKRHFKETDQLNPVNRYGRQKSAAEYLVRMYGYNVVRFPFLIAPSLLPYKKHFYDQIADTISKGEKMEMFVDSMRSSLDFATAADLVIQLMEKYREDMPDILNVSGDDDLSKYDVGIMIAKKLGVSKELIVPITAEKPEGIFDAKRAKSTLLDNSQVKKYLGLQEIKIHL